MASVTCSLLLNSTGLAACCPCKAMSAAGRNDTAALQSARSLFVARGSEVLLKQACADSKPIRPSKAATAGELRCQASDLSSDQGNISRRAACLSVLGATLASTVQISKEASAKEIEVGALYPAAPDPKFVIFKPTPNQTPALRAGNLSPYQFWIPPSWKEARVANILSGNYCQPKCAEPWVEAKFENPKQGNIQVIISPLVRLTNVPGASIESIGSAEDIINSLGQFVTGNSIEPEEIVEVDSKKNGDRTYYSYAVDSPYAKNGTHNLAVATAKDNAVYLFVVSANDKQWASNEKVLRTIQQSFSV